MKNQRKWVVVDGENNVSYDADEEKAQAFKSFDAAKKRAEEIAEAEPGTEVLICEAHTIVSAAVNPVKARPATSRGANV